MKFIVIGITDNPQPWFPPEVMEMIRQGRVFSGGKRHHEIVASLLPDGAEWIDITASLNAVFEQYISHTSEIIVFASGDPLFFGFANTIKRKMPDAEIVLYPTFNSLQMLAHRLVMAYHDMRIVSLTGRPWPEFDKALIEGEGKIGVLTDREHTPATIAQRMLEYGYHYYKMHVGEHLGNPELEKVTTLTLEEASHHDFDYPNCVLLELIGDGSSEFDNNSASRTQTQKNRPLWVPFGIPDAEFALLDGREKMITKMPIRLLTLQALDLPKRHVLWDIGSCTGSVSIETRLQFPHLHIEAFEIRPECEAIIQENARRFGAPGINVHIGDFLETDITTLPRPDAVFIGGHGGKLKEIMAKVLAVLTEDGCIVMNSVKAPKVTTDSHQLWDEVCQELGLQQESPMRIIIDEHHPIEILKAHK
ncbi:MAG: precorrin-6y C5,15-methyltransferase (decarboxylating) subunit CbiE [Prevotella sp.]|nr:precorrin-6y C5,15-methyltransferase (decarboxylating) subunit CbiE [Prevotella sp.]